MSFKVKLLKGLGTKEERSSIRTYFQYPAGYRISKLSGYRISGWFLMPDIRIFFWYRTLARYPTGTGYPALEISRISGIWCPAKKESNPTLAATHVKPFRLTIKTGVSIRGTYWNCTHWLHCFFLKNINPLKKKLDIRMLFLFWERSYSVICACLFVMSIRTNKQKINTLPFYQII